MMAISLWQPWASLVAIGAKSYETRYWGPPPGLIGARVLIHAAKKPMPRGIDGDPDFAAAFGEPGWWRHVPMGAFVCSAMLRGAYLLGCTRGDRVDVDRAVAGSPPLDSIPLDDFGDYSPRRFAWHLTDIERFAPAITARGRQGFWRVEPDDLTRAVEGAF